MSQLKKETLRRLNQIRDIFHIVQFAHGFRKIRAVIQVEQRQEVLSYFVSWEYVDTKPAAPCRGSRLKDSVADQLQLNLAMSVLRWLSSSAGSLEPTESKSSVWLSSSACHSEGVSAMFLLNCSSE